VDVLSLPLFVSDRERRLWFWTLTVIVGIYSTLGPARTLVDALRERNLLRVAFGVLVLMVAVGVSLQSLKKRPGWSEIGVALAVALAYWMTFLRIGNPAERTHLIEYGIVAALMHQALLERVAQARRVPMPAALTVGVTAVLGLIDEGIQAVLPSRVFDWTDVFFNALAGFMVIVARLALAPVRRPGWRLWFLWLMAGSVGWGWSMDTGTFAEGPSFVILPSLPTVVIPFYLSVAVGATIVGVLQWLILRRYVRGAVVWVAASVGAAGLGALVVLGVGLLGGRLGHVVGVGLYGTLAGLLQWAVLRQHVPRAGWWVLASTVGWVVAIPVGDIAGPPGWAIYSAVTGTAMVVLLRNGGRAVFHLDEVHWIPGRIPK
jgi:hypothetical protein